jgi:prepilin-type N-terminal cleavage/methylation domain-containing protein
LRAWNSFLKNKKAGFSLVELLVVVAVIMIIGSISAPLGTIIFYREKEIILRQNLTKIRKAIDDYYEYSKGRYNLLEQEMTDAEYMPDNKDYKGTKYTSDEYWDWKFYPSSWNELYINNFLKPEDAINPFSGVPEDYDIVIAVPLEYIQDKRIQREYGAASFFKLPRYPDPQADYTAPASVNGDPADRITDLSSNIIKYNLVPAVTDSNGKAVLKYIFSKKEWYEYFIDAQSGNPMVFSGEDPRIDDTPVTYPFKLSGSAPVDAQIPFYSPRIFDVRYPEHHIALDGHTYYDQW